MNTNNTGVLILAAGKGTRMHSAQPKVLQKVLDEPMLAYVMDAVEPLFGNNVWTIIGHQAEMVRAAFPDCEEKFILQQEQLGTGHALQIAWPVLKKAGLKNVLVVSGDIPLLSTEMIYTFLTAMQRNPCPLGFITLTLESSGAYGRVVRQKNEVVDIVEAKDYLPAVHGMDTGEINTGVYFLNMEKLEGLLPLLNNNNNSKEYYITDLVPLAVKAGMEVAGIQCGDETLLGVNSPCELVQAESLLQSQIISRWIDAGAGIHFENSVVIGPNVALEAGARVYGPCHLYGNTVVAKGAVVEPYCMIKNSIIGENTVVRSFCHLEDAILAENCVAGPYARLRPGTVLQNGARVGNFVEMKKSTLGKGAKAGHLTYLGDTIVGERANIGAGTITCNYDGKNKFQTQIGDEAFIGSNSALVAPVCIGKNSMVAAGSVITKDVPDNSLAFGRAKQVVREKK